MVADARMLSATILNSLEDAGFSFKLVSTPSSDPSLMPDEFLAQISEANGSAYACRVLTEALATRNPDVEGGTPTHLPLLLDLLD